MKQERLIVSGFINMRVESVGGDLQVVGWERMEVQARTDGDVLTLAAEEQTIRAGCPGDLILYLPREANLQIMSVAGDADLRALTGSVQVQSVGGDLQMRNVGAVDAGKVGGDLSVRSCVGGLSARSVGGDASLRDIHGAVMIVAGADLYFRGGEGALSAQVGADAALYLRPQAGCDVSVKAGSNILLRLPARVDAELSLQGCDDESIRVDLPGVEQVGVGMFRTLKLGAGGPMLSLIAGAEVIVTSREEEWENMAEFDPLGRDGPFAPGEFPGLSSELHERISRRVEDATRRALEASMRAREQTEQAQRRVDRAMRRAEEKMHTVERRNMHFGVKVGRFGMEVDDRRPAPSGEVLASEPVSDDERLVVLKMLQEKKISIQEAEKLLAALDGK